MDWSIYRPWYFNHPMCSAPSFIYARPQRKKEKEFGIILIINPLVHYAFRWVAIWQKTAVKQVLTAYWRHWAPVLRRRGENSARDSLARPSVVGFLTDALVCIKQTTRVRNRRGRQHGDARDGAKIYRCGADRDRNPCK